MKKTPLESRLRDLLHRIPEQKITKAEYRDLTLRGVKFLGKKLSDGRLQCCISHPNTSVTYTCEQRFRSDKDSALCWVFYDSYYQVEYWPADNDASRWVVEHPITFKQRYIAHDKLTRHLQRLAYWWLKNDERIKFNKDAKTWIFHPENGGECVTFTDLANLDQFIQQFDAELASQAAEQEKRLTGRKTFLGAFFSTLLAIAGFADMSRESSSRNQRLPSNESMNSVLTVGTNFLINQLICTTFQQPYMLLRLVFPINYLHRPSINKPLNKAVMALLANQFFSVGSAQEIPANQQDAPKKFELMEAGDTVYVQDGEIIEISTGSGDSGVPIAGFANQDFVVAGEGPPLTYRYNADNAITSSQGFSGGLPDLATWENGDYVVAYYHFSGHIYGLIPGVVSFQLSTTPNEGTFKPRVSVATYATGLVAAWAAWDYSGPIQELRTVFQLADTQGNLLGSEVLIGTFIGHPKVATYNNQYLMVAYSTTSIPPDTGNPDGSLDVYIKSFSITGSQLSGDILVNSDLRVGTQNSPVLSAYSNGFILCWGSGPTTDERDVFCQRLTGTGSKIGNPILVSTFSVNSEVEVAGFDNGFVVTWRSTGGPQAPGIYINVYDLNGESLFGETLVFHSQAGPRHPHVAGLGSNFALSWYTISPAGGNVVRYKQVSRPSATFGASTVTFTEGSVAVPVDSLLTLSDADSANFQSAELSISNNFIVGEDQLLFTNFNNITGNYNSNSGVLIFSGQALIEEYVELLRNVTYYNSNLVNPNTATRTIELVVNDGEIESQLISKSIIIQAINNFPVLQNNSFVIQQGQSLIVTSSMLSAIDVDNAVESLMFKLSNIVGGQFELVSQPGIAITQFTQQQIIDEAIVFVPVADAIIPAFDISVDDGTDSTTPQAATIEYHATAPKNTPPVLTTTSVRELNITSGAAAAYIDPIIVASDDSGFLQNATVSIISSDPASVDLLSIQIPISLSQQYSSQLRILNLFGNASVANYEGILRNLVLSTRSDTNQTTTRNVSIVVGDEALLSNILTYYFTVFANVSAASNSSNPVGPNNPTEPDSGLSASDDSRLWIYIGTGIGGFLLCLLLSFLRWRQIKQLDKRAKGVFTYSLSQERQTARLLRLFLGDRRYANDQLELCFGKLIKLIQIDTQDAKGQSTRIRELIESLITAKQIHGDSDINLARTVVDKYSEHFTDPTEQFDELFANMSDAQIQLLSNYEHNNFGSLLTLSLDDTKAFHYLLAKGFEVNFQTKRSGNTVLHNAGRYPEHVELLISKYGADFSLTNNKNLTPLQVYIDVMRQADDIPLYFASINILLKHGAQLNIEIKQKLEQYFDSRRYSGEQFQYLVIAYLQLLYTCEKGLNKIVATDNLGFINWLQVCPYKDSKGKPYTVHPAYETNIEDKIGCLDEVNEGNDSDNESVSSNIIAISPRQPKEQAEYLDEKIPREKTPMVPYLQTNPVISSQKMRQLVEEIKAERENDQDSGLMDVLQRRNISLNVRDYHGRSLVSYLLYYHANFVELNQLLDAPTFDWFAGRFGERPFDVLLSCAEIDKSCQEILETLVQSCLPQAIEQESKALVPVSSDISSYSNSSHARLFSQHPEAEHSMSLGVIDDTSELKTSSVEMFSLVPAQQRIATDANRPVNYDAFIYNALQHVVAAVSSQSEGQFLLPPQRQHPRGSDSRYSNNSGGSVVVINNNFFINSQRRDCDSNSAAMKDFSMI